MCGACVSDCTVLEVDSNFLGPAALAKAYRFAGDPRDDADEDRLAHLNEYGGIWDCTRCLKCVEVCPKDVAPMDRIMGLRDKAMEAGFTQSYGARHAAAFTDLVGHSGTLDELRLPIKTFGVTNVKEMLKLAPVACEPCARARCPPCSTRAFRAWRTSSASSRKSRTSDEVRPLPPDASRVAACRELYAATMEVCRRLGIDVNVDIMSSASCTGAGVLQEKNQRLGDTLNARNFALSERGGLPLMTICSTCQGVMSQANDRLTSDYEYLKSINADLAEEGLE